MTNTGNIFILGDSYSTFTGYIPEGYYSYYTPEKQDYTDLTRVEDTWWHRVASATGGTIVRNCSWSGTTMCNTGYGGFCPDSSFVGRFDRLAEQGFFNDNKIDTVFIFGGTNDSWADSPVGENKYADFTEDDLLRALPAFCYLLSRVKECVPGARVVNILNDVVVKAELTDGYAAACDHYGVEIVRAGDFAMDNGHPNILGMEQICDRVIRVLDK